MNSRLTVTAGLRYDNAGGYPGGDDPDNLGKVYSVNAFAPRLGFAYDLTGDQKTVLKAHYGDFVDQLAATYFRYAASKLGPYIGYTFNADGTGEFVGPAGNTFDISRQVDYPYYNVDPNLKHPRVRQYSLALERALSNDLRISVTGVYRKWHNFADTVLPDARWEAFEGANDLTGEPLTFWALTNPDEATANFLITNPDGFQYLDPAGNVIGTARRTAAQERHVPVEQAPVQQLAGADISYVTPRPTAPSTTTRTARAPRTSSRPTSRFASSTAR